MKIKLLIGLILNHLRVKFSLFINPSTNLYNCSTKSQSTAVKAHKPEKRSH